jgi:hypothetical protein
MRPKGLESMMGLAGGGKIKQVIKADIYSQDTWLKDLSVSIPVYILNSEAFRRVTGRNPPPSPVTIRDYADAGLPFFNLYETLTHISGSQDFAPLKSLNEMKQQKGLATVFEDAVRPRIVNLNDPDGLVDGAGTVERQLEVRRDWMTYIKREGSMVNVKAEEVDEVDEEEDPWGGIF